MISFLLTAFFACSTSTTPSTNEQRFISLHPSVTETLYALGAENYTIGRSDFCAVPEQVSTLPSFGTAITPNFEQIAMAEPTYILGDSSLGQHQEALSQITTVKTLPWLSIEDMKTSIQTLGAITNTADQAKTIISDLDNAFTNLPTPKTDVLLLLSGSEITKGQLWFIKPESIHGAMLEASGYANSVPKGQNIPQMSVESLLQLNPSVIAIFGDKTTPTTEMKTKGEALRTLESLTAVKQGHICLLSLNNAFGTGPSIVDNVQQMQQQLDTCLQ